MLWCRCNECGRVIAEDEWTCDECADFLNEDTRTTPDGRQILTRHERPPVPASARMDWIAWIEGDEEFGSGLGATEAEAIEDLKRQIIDHDDVTGDGQPSEQEEWRDYDSHC